MIIYNALESMTLKDGKLRVAGFKEEDYFNMYKELRVALVDYLLPIYMPIAFNAEVQGPVTDTSSFFTPIKGLNSTPLEFWLKCHKLIFAESYGIATAKLNTNEPLENFGHIKGGGEVIIAEDSLCFVEPSVSDGGAGTLIQDIPLRPLVRGISLVEGYKFYGGQNYALVDILLRKGTGIFDFTQSQEVIKYTREFKYPLRAIYSLSELCSLHVYDGEDYLQFHYTEDIDEDVLCDIIRNFFLEGGLQQ